MVQVRPLVSIPGYDGLQVTLPGLVVSDEDVDRQVDRLRENDAELELVGRPAIDGDLVTIDLHGNDASGAEVVGVDDYLYEVGSGTVTPELDEKLRGAKAGDILDLHRRPRPATRTRSSRSGSWSKTSRSRSCPSRPTNGPPRAPSSPPWPSCGRTSPTAWPG